MTRTRLWITTLAGLIAAVAIGYFGWQALHTVFARQTCPHSAVAAMALPAVKDPAIRKEIEALDATYTAAFQDACGRLCRERLLLAQRLETAPPADPETAARLAALSGLQAQLEQLTWNHLIAVRDTLPEQERAAFIDKVKSQWTAGQRHLRQAAEKQGACPAHGGK